MNGNALLMNFWYEFDRYFNPGFGHTPPDILQAYRFESGLLPNWLVDRDDHRESLI